MKIAIGSAPLGRAGDTTLVTGDQQTDGSGKPYIVLDTPPPVGDGPIMSVQEDGSVQGRATAGPWEWFIGEGGTAVWMGGGTTPYKFLYSAQLPS